MNASTGFTVVKSGRRHTRAGRPNSRTFCWWAIMNIPTREPVHGRNVGRGWRVLLMDPMP